MDRQDLGQARGLSREGRADPGEGRSRTTAPLPPAPNAPLSRTGLLQIISSRVIPAQGWNRPVFYDEEAYASAAALQTALAKKRQGLPAYAYGSRSLKAELNANALLAVIFPDGIPTVEEMTIPVQEALKNLMASAKALYDSPGMEKLECDRRVVVVCNEDAFIAMMETCIAKSGQEL